MARTKRWSWKNLGSGIAEVRISSWKYFGDFVYQEMLDFDAYVWRGHRCADWTLEPTFARLAREAKKNAKQTENTLTKHLEQFKFAARGRWDSIMGSQHHC